MKRRGLFVILAVVAALTATGAGCVVHAHRAAAAKECIENLRRIDSAKNQWAMETIRSTNSSAFRFYDTDSVLAVIDTNPITNVTPSVEEIHIYLGCDLKMPSCPIGGTYSMGRIGEPPRCSIPGHRLEYDDPKNQ